MEDEVNRIARDIRRPENILENQHDVEMPYFRPGLVRQLSEAEAQVVPDVAIKKSPMAPKKIRPVFTRVIDEACVPVVKLPPGFGDLQMENLKLRRAILEHQTREVAANQESNRIKLEILRRSRRLYRLICMLFYAKYCKKDVKRGWRNFWLKERLAKCRLPISLKSNRKRSARYKEKIECWKELKFACECLKNKIQCTRIG